MISIGMIGADSSHTEAYATLANPAGAPLHQQARIVKLWGDDLDQARQKAAACEVPQVVANPEEAISNVDLVIVCNRYGDDHPPYVRLALEAGIPTFVDKPFANDFDSVRDLVHMAQQRGVPLMSCSPIRYARELLEVQQLLSGFGPVNCAVTSGMATGDFPNPRAKHPFFYGIHPVELLHALLGPGAETVTTQRTSRSDVATVSYADGRQGVINLFQKTPSLYHGIVFGANGWGEVNIRDYESFYLGTLTHAVAMAESGQPPLPIEWALEVIAILTALIRSAEEGGKRIELSEL
jgi:predicted dehydrogenase